jgi:hypothetical protein
MSNKIAFLLQTHVFSPQIERLCLALKQFNDYQVYLHHDYSQSHFPQESIDRFNIKVISKYRTTAWADVSQTYTELDLLNFAYHDSDENIWFILLSGSCYPIKSANQIEEFLEKSEFDGYLNITPASPKGSRLKRRWHQRIFWRIIFDIPFISKTAKFYWRPVRIPRLKTPFSKNYHLYFGANWFILRRQAVTYILNQNPWEHPVMKFFEQCKQNRDREVISSDEILLSTLLGNQESCNIHKNYMRYINWENSKNYHPNVLTLEHWNEIKQSDALFARKFAVPESAGLLERIDREILGL